MYEFFRLLLAKLSRMSYRTSYIGRTKTSGAFRTSNTGVRSGFGKFSRSSGRFGASGGGGAQGILKRDRW